MEERDSGTLHDVNINDENVIIKCIPQRFFRKKEIYFLKKAQNVPGLVQYITHFKLNHCIYIIIHKISHVVDLDRFITEKGQLTEPDVKHILAQLITILLWCKQNSILHNHIKNENILIDPLTLTITLTNFGAAESWHNNFYYDYKGHPLYSCPEWFLFNKYTANEMISWSIGILMYSLLFGHKPFPSVSDMIQNNVTFPKTENISSEALTFLTKCLDKNTTTRILLDQMMNEEWLNSYFCV